VLVVSFAASFIPVALDQPLVFRGGPAILQLAQYTNQIHTIQEPCMTENGLILSLHSRCGYAHLALCSGVTVVGAAAAKQHTPRGHDDDLWI
jgi:hypothetical protein